MYCYECFRHCHYAHDYTNRKKKKGKTMQIICDISDDSNGEESNDDLNNFSFGYANSSCENRKHRY